LVAPSHGPAPALAALHFKRAVALGQPDTLLQSSSQSSYLHKSATNLNARRQGRLNHSSSSSSINGVNESPEESGALERARLQHMSKLKQNLVAAQAASARLQNMKKSLSKMPIENAAALVNPPYAQ